MLPCFKRHESELRRGRNDGLCTACAVDLDRKIPDGPIVCSKWIRARPLLRHAALGARTDGLPTEGRNMMFRRQGLVGDRLEEFHEWQGALQFRAFSVAANPFTLTRMRSQRIPGQCGSHWRSGAVTSYIPRWASALLQLRPPERTTAMRPPSRFAF